MYHPIQIVIIAINSKIKLTDCIPMLYARAAGIDVVDNRSQDVPKIDKPITPNTIPIIMNILLVS